MGSFNLLPKKTKRAVNEVVKVVRGRQPRPTKDEIREMALELNDTNLSDEEFVQVVKDRLEDLQANPTYSDIQEELKQVKKFTFNEGASYQFLFKDGVEFNLSAEEALSRKKFDALYMSFTSKVPLDDATAYKVFLARALSAKNTVKTTEDHGVDSVGEAKDAVLRFIEGAKLVESVEQTRFSSENIWVQESKIYIPSQTLRQIIEREKLKVSMEKLRVLLSDMLVCSSQNVRVKEKTMRFWVFDVAKIPFQLKLQVVRADNESPAEVQPEQVAPSSGTAAPTVQKPRVLEVKILKPIPQYVGAVGEKFGPYEPGSVHTLPEAEAAWLIKGKLAEVVSHG